MHADKVKLLRVAVVAALVLGLMGGAMAESYSWDSESSAETFDCCGGAGMSFTVSNSGGVALEYVDLYSYIEGRGITVYVHSVSEGEDIASSVSGSEGASFDNVRLRNGETYQIYTDAGYQARTNEISYGSNSYVDINYHVYGCLAGSGCEPKSPGGSYQLNSIQFNPDYNFNNAPEFNSSSVSPDPVLIGENVSYSANVSDSDGSIDYTNLTVEYGGSVVVSDAQRSGTTSPEWNNIYKPDSGNKWLNATLETVDDAGATTTTELNRYLNDEPPNVQILEPGNQTYWKYEIPFNVTADDIDNVPNEDYTCKVFSDNQQILFTPRIVAFNEGGYFADNFRRNLGSHNVTVECEDPAGNTGSDSEYFSVDNFEQDSVSGDSQAYETSNESFSVDWQAGDMVNQVETRLFYNQSFRDTETSSVNGYTSASNFLNHAVGLVQSNQTIHDWKVVQNVNYNTFNGGTTTTQFNSTTQNQEILWSYYIKNSGFTPDNKYIETENLQHQTTIATETKKANLSATTTYHRNGDTAEAQKTSSNTTTATFLGTHNTGTAQNFNQSTFNASTEIQVDFNGDTRNLDTGKDNLELYRIQLFDTANPGNLNTEETLVFDIDYEEEGYDTKAEFTMDLSVWKDQDRKIRRFQFQETEAQEHKYHIYPSWAEYTIQTKPYPEQTKFDLIQYFNPDDNKVRRSYFFPTPQQITNTTTTVPLKTINSTEATQIDFEVTQSGGQPAENTYCRVDRKFGGGDFETVFQIKTGGQGNSQSFAEVNEIYYSFTCYKNGEVIETFPAQIMQNPMVLQIGETEVETGLDYSEEFDASCSSNASSISCNYQSQTESLDYAELTVNRVEPVTDIQVCEKTGPTATGTLNCGGLNTSKHQYKFTATGTYPRNITVIGESGKTGSQGSQYGASGIMLTMFIFLFVFAATAFNVPLGIGLGTLSILFSSLAGFLALTPAMRATLIGLAIITGVVARR